MGKRNDSQGNNSCCQVWEPKFKDLFFYFIYVNYLIYLHTLSLSSDTPEESIGSHYRWLWATISLLGVELRTSGRAVSALNRWAISPAQHVLISFLYICLCACVCVFVCAVWVPQHACGQKQSVGVHALYHVSSGVELGPSCLAASLSTEMLHQPLISIF